MNFQNLHKIYFVGIGGIGMSALARYFNSIHKSVAGYDKIETELTRSLEREGIQLVYSDQTDQIPQEYLKTDTLIVYTPAISENHPQLTYFKENDFELVKRSQLLGLITENTFNVSVAGTHGKTTTSSILAFLLTGSVRGCNAFLGGIATNFNSNLVLNSDSDVTVAEADEFDRSFLTMTPNIAVVTSMDADHLDVYKDENDLVNSFTEFANRLDKDGVLIVKEGLEFSEPIDRKIIRYGWGEECDVKIENIQILQGTFVFDLSFSDYEIKELKLSLPGRHNVENATASIIAALEIGMSIEAISNQLMNFKGVKRRFEHHVKNESTIYIDDYAHHPTEIDAAISASKELYPKKEITGIFQPHLYSRTQDFVNEFVESLEQLDRLILLDIYPARELPIEGVTAEWLLSKIKKEKKCLLKKGDVLQHLIENKPEVLLTLGAGDIDQLIEPIKQTLLSI